MSDEGEKMCPLCAEEMDLTDQQLKPCKCGYEICVWCWHHVMDMAEKDDSEGRCPACRAPYDKEKIVGMAGNCERLVAEISMERKKSQKAKTKPSEGRKQLSSVRVIQRNLVYIVGLPLNLADEDLLQRREYFGQYGKVLKVSMSRTAAGVIQQFPNNTCSVYITFSKEEEAIRCIQSVHGFVLDGRSLKACFGTTKYCHAWLRNVPCTNPDCLYLHEIGSQEDSFTKDEIISAYTRVQQITGATSNMLRRSGSMLPPPADDYCDNSTASAAKPIVRNTSSQSTPTIGKGSPPNGSIGRSITLPVAASWGMRASSQSQVSSSTCANGPTKHKPGEVSCTLALSSAVASATQASTILSDVGKKASWNEEAQAINGRVKSDSLKPVNHHVQVGCRADVLEKPVINEASATLTSSDQPCLLTSNYEDWETNVVPNATSSFQAGQSCGHEKEGTAATDGKVKNSCSDILARVDGNIGSTLSDHSTIKSRGNKMFLQPHPEQFREPLTSVVEKTAQSMNVSSASSEHNWRTDPQTEAGANAVSQLEKDIISFENQRLKDPEVVSRTTYLPNSANSLHLSNHSRSHSSRQNDAYGAMNLNADAVCVDNRVGDRSLLYPSSNSIISNGCPDKLNSSSISSNKNMGSSFLLPSEGEGKHMARLQDDDESNNGLDIGESSIISNILSLELDAWEGSLTSPQNLAKLLGETDKQNSSLKISNTGKVQNNSQSRFSFARQEEPRNQLLEVDPSFSVFGQLPKNNSFSQDFCESRNSHLDRPGIVNGFSSSNYEESETFTCNSSPSVLSSNSSSVSRALISAPPGFSIPNRAPPPGFSSHERTYDSFSGNHLLDSSSSLRTSYQAPPTANIVSTGDIEFMDPAILAVGKGRLQIGLNNPVSDMRSSIPQQLTFENEARRQLLMQRSPTTHPSLRFPDIGDIFSSLSDSYGISSRHLDQSQVSNLSHFAQLPHQYSRNGLMSNSQWDGWNEVQGGNSVAMAELFRNERLGFNKYYASGYEDPRFRMPSSGDLYNGTI